MLESMVIKQKLYDLAAAFKVHMRAKRYVQAKRCYDNARLIAVFHGMEEDEKEKLFGVRGKRGEIMKEGLFQEEMVQKAYLETCVKAKQIPEDCVLCQKHIRGEL